VELVAGEDCGLTVALGWVVTLLGVLTEAFGRGDGAWAAQRLTASLSSPTVWRAAARLATSMLARTRSW
jgi:hypothetical protein